MTALQLQIRAIQTKLNTGKFGTEDAKWLISEMFRLSEAFIKLRGQIKYLDETCEYYLKGAQSDENKRGH